MDEEELIESAAAEAVAEILKDRESMELPLRMHVRVMRRAAEMLESLENKPANDKGPLRAV